MVLPQAGVFCQAGNRNRRHMYWNEQYPKQVAIKVNQNSLSATLGKENDT